MKSFRKGEMIRVPEMTLCPVEKKVCMTDDPYEVVEIINFDNSEFLKCFLYGFNTSQDIGKFAVYHDGRIKRV